MQDPQSLQAPNDNQKRLNNLLNLQKAPQTVQQDVQTVTRVQQDVQTVTTVQQDVQTAPQTVTTVQQDVQTAPQTVTTVQQDVQTVPQIVETAPPDPQISVTAAPTIGMIEPKVVLQGNLSLFCHNFFNYVMNNIFK